MPGDRFRRTRLLLGDAAVEKLAAARVTVVGLGAVGSYAVEGLARSGVGALRLVDFDTVHVTNINRQLYALESTLDQPKTEVARERVLEINPACRVEAVSAFVNRDTVAGVLDPVPDLLVDAIDSLGPKAALLAEAAQRDIPVVSSMGAALRRDPSRIRIGPLFATSGCPLARHLRKRLRRLAPSANIVCVYSDEPVPDVNAGADDGEDSLLATASRPRRVLGSMSTLTGIFGLYLATEAIRRLSTS